MIAIDAVPIDKVTVVPGKLPYRDGARSKAEQSIEKSPGLAAKRNSDVIPEGNSPAAAAFSGQKEPGRKVSLSKNDLMAKIDEANALLEKQSNRQRRFCIDHETGQQGVPVINAKTREIIKQIPPEELVELTKRIKENLGVLLDEVV